MTADGDAQVCASVVSVAMCYSILPVFDQWRRSQQKLKSFLGIIPNLVLGAYGWKSIRQKFWL